MATVEHRLRHREDGTDSPADEARARLECLYRAHGERVLAICASVLRDRHEAEDAAQQVFVSAFRALLRGSAPRDPGAWLATIARNESWARARRRESIELQPEQRDVSQEDPSTVAVWRDELARVWRAIESLPASQRDALVLREVRGLGYDELADGLQVTNPSVRSLLNRARRTLRSQLQKGAATLSGAPWLSVLARTFGDGSSSVLSSASRTAAVGLGALAITGGAVVAPSLTGPVHRTPAVAAVAHSSAAATPAAREPERVGAGVAVAPATPLPRGTELHRDRRVVGAGSRGGEDRRGGDDASGGGSSRHDGSSGAADSGSGSPGGEVASSGRGNPGSGSSSGSGGGDHGSGTDGGSGGVSRSGDGVRLSPSGSDGSGGTSGGDGAGRPTTGDTSSSDGSQTTVTSASSSGGGSSGSSGGSGSDGGSTSSGSVSTSGSGSDDSVGLSGGSGGGS